MLCSTPTARAPTRAWGTTPMRLPTRSEWWLSSQNGRKGTHERQPHYTAWGGASARACSR
eukprot:scaffold11043_cov111-Isochrysis_galbana.AAC.6